MNRKDRNPFLVRFTAPHLTIEILGIHLGVDVAITLIDSSGKPKRLRELLDVPMPNCHSRPDPQRWAIRQAAELMRDCLMPIISGKQQLT